jgi:hypothetical protein
MPIELSTPTIIIPVKTATAFEIVGFGVNIREHTLDLVYETGDMLNGAFLSNGQQAQIHLAGIEFDDFLVANPTLYAPIKDALYALIQQRHGVTGTIV